MATSLIIGKLADYKAKYFPHLASNENEPGVLTEDSPNVIEPEYMPEPDPCAEPQPLDPNVKEVEQDA